MFNPTIGTGHGAMEIRPVIETGYGAIDASPMIETGYGPPLDASPRLETGCGAIAPRFEPRSDFGPIGLPLSTPPLYCVPEIPLMRHESPTGMSRSHERIWEPPEIEVKPLLRRRELTSDSVLSVRVDHYTPPESPIDMQALRELTRSTHERTWEPPELPVRLERYTPPEPQLDVNDFVARPLLDLSPPGKPFGLPSKWESIGNFGIGGPGEGRCLYPGLVERSRPEHEHGTMGPHRHEMELYSIFGGTKPVRKATHIFLFPDGE